MKKSVAFLGLSLLVNSSALAHEPRPGPNGGLKVDAGSYHAELLADGTDTVTVFLFDANDQPVDSAGFKANAISHRQRKANALSLEPAGGQKLSGKAPSEV